MTAERLDSFCLAASNPSKRPPPLPGNWPNAPAQPGSAYGVDMLCVKHRNAVVHGNKRDQTKTVTVVLTSSPGVLEIEVSDQGTGFDPESVPDPTAGENVLKTSGRGIFFMRTFMDEVSWSNAAEGGTTVRMIKRS